MGGGAATGEPANQWGQESVDLIRALQPAHQGIATTCARPSSRSETAWPWRCGDKVEAALIDHVNNLKLQYLVELSKLGDTCADLETEVVDAGSQSTTWSSPGRRSRSC